MILLMVGVMVGYEILAKYGGLGYHFGGGMIFGRSQSGKEVGERTRICFVFDEISKYYRVW